MTMRFKDRAQALGKASLHLADPLLDSLNIRRITLFSSASRPKIIEAYTEIFRKLCTYQEGRYTYAEELDALAKKSDTTGTALLAKALEQLQQKALKLDIHGLPTNTEEVGKEFSIVLNFLQKRVSFFVVVDRSQLHKLPLSKNYQQQLAGLVESEVAMLILVKLPPEPARREMECISADQFHGLTIWLDKENRRLANISRELDDYLKFATVRILCTGHAESTILAKAANEALEANGFEQHHVQRVIASTFESEKNESLAGVLKVSALVIAGVKAVEHFYPTLVHIVGGILDDLFGAILPDVSQSWGRTGKFMDKMRRAFSVFIGGSLGLPVSFAAGWAASVLYSDQASDVTRIAAGVCFAIACAAGTVGTSVAAIARAFKGLVRTIQEHDLTGFSFFKKLGVAIDESLLKVPFRIGHTLIALPLQIGLGALAGYLHFFNDTKFITIEGIMESALGAGVAFLYPKIADTVHQRRLKKI